MARPPFQPTDEQRKYVCNAAARGIPQLGMCTKLGITDKTLRKHFKAELETGLHEANFVVAGALFDAATGGNITAQIFWLKARAGWREVQVVEHKGKAAGMLEAAQKGATALALTTDPNEASRIYADMLSAGRDEK